MSDETISTDEAAPPRPASGSGFSMSARDLINVALFAVLYFVLVFAVSMLGVISPLVMLLTLPLSIIAAGIPFLLFLTRVKHPGLLALFGTVVGLANLAGGLPWISTVITIALAVVGEVILRVARYRSRWAAIWAYAVFSLWYIGPMIPFLMDREAYLRSPGMQLSGAEYVAAFDQLFSVPMIWVYNLSTLVCGVLGGLLGSAVLRKHFVRAGLG